MKFRCKATGMSFDGCHTTNSLKRIKAMFQCCDTQECHCTVLHHGCRCFRHLFLSRKYMIQTEAVEDVYRANWKKNIWIHAVRKSMHRGDDYPSNTHTKKNGPAWPQDSLSSTNLWLGVETAYGAVTCLCLDQNDRNQISYIGILGGKQELIHFLNAPVAAWCFW